MTLSSLEITEAECAENAVAPRVSLGNILTRIAHEYYATGADFLDFLGVPSPPGDTMAVFTICFLQLDNGFIVVGDSCPASAANFNPQLGQKLARENAVRKLWPLMGFQLREDFFRALNPGVPPASPAPSGVLGAEEAQS